MPRTARRNIKSKMCHVIVQGIDKEYIFNKEIHKNKYLKELQQNAKLCNINILAYAIMDNHVHICVYYKKIENLSQYMHIINSNFARYYNFSEKRVGYVFRNRYYTQQILNKMQLFNTIAYIHNNPVKAGIVNNLSDYKFSSYNNFINNKVDSQTIKLIFETEKYMDIFNYIHKNYDALEVADIDFECKDKEKILNEFLQENKVNLNDIKQEICLLSELIKKLKVECRLNGKEIAEFLNIDKNKVTKANKYIMNEKSN